MFGIILTPFYKAILIFATVVAIFATGYYKGYRNTQEKFDAYKAEVAAVAAQQEAKTKVINQNNTKVAKETSNAYKDNLAAVRDYYNRMHNDGSKFVSRLPDASSGTNAASSYDVLAGQCAETTLQVVTLQKFINETAANY